MPIYSLVFRSSMPQEYYCARTECEPSLLSNGANDAGELLLKAFIL